MGEQAQRHLGTEARSDRETPLAASRHIRRAFNLTELMIAVAVLIVVIIATSQIFGTASKITGLGTATTAVMTEASTIERMMRDDIAKLTTEGFFAIRCVSIRNDYYRNAPLPPHVADPNAPLLNPNLPDDAWLRADQLVFFANGVASMQTFRPNADAIVRAQSLVSRVYYGHAFQLLNGSPARVEAPNVIRAHDANSNVTPWHRSGAGVTNVPMSTNLFGTFSGIGTSGAGTDMFSPTAPAAGPTLINGTQPDPRQWLLSRQAVILIDDDETERFRNSKTVVFNDHVTARSIFLQSTGAVAPWGWSRELRNGRLDAAASQLNDIRRWVMYNDSAFAPTEAARRQWRGAANDQRTIIQNAVYYPRGERKAPGPNRIDQALTNHVIGSACSSFAIDWVYDGTFDGRGDAIGYAVNSGNFEFLGVQINPAIEQPWFGMSIPDLDGDGISDDRGVMNYSNWGGGAQTILPINTFPNNIETSTANTASFRDYWAIFGYNQTEPFDPRPTLTGGTVNPNYGQLWASTPPVEVGYTPFPSAIRVTMTLHDAEGRLEGGREVQFVIRLPRRLK